MRNVIAHFSIAAVLFAGGCGSTDPDPPAMWTGAMPAKRMDINAAPPVRDLSEEPYFAVDVTSLPPDRIIDSARSICEPMHGPMKCTRTKICNGRTVWLLQSPRFDVANHNLDYHWVEVTINLNPLNGISLVEVNDGERTWRPMRFTVHGGVLPFPTSIDSRIANVREHAILRSIMQSLNDPQAYITEWGKLPEDE